MDDREKEIRTTLLEIKSLLGNTPPPEWGVEELIVHCWNLYELVEQLQDLTGADTSPIC